MVVVPGTAVFARVYGRDPTPAARSRPGILLIDRQPLFLAVLERLLSTPPLNARVQSFSQSDEALQALEARGADVLLCELRAQPLSGLEVQDQVARRAPQVPVVMLGESSDGWLLMKALESGAAAIFTKDAAPAELVEGMRAVLSGHRAVGSALLQQLSSRRDVNEVRGGMAGRLSPTELSILALLGSARSIREIAEIRGISPKTVRNHLANIYRKLDVRSRTQAMLFATRIGLKLE